MSVVRSPRVFYAQLLCVCYCLWKFQRIVMLHKDLVVRGVPWLLVSREYQLIAAENGRIFYVHPDYSADRLMSLAQDCFGGRVGIRTR